MAITLLEAAKLCELDKSTLRKSVKTGRISGTRDDKGVWWVEMSEVTRVYPVIPAADPQAVPRSSTPTSAPDADIRTGDAATDMMVTTLREALARAETAADRERERAEQERQRADQERERNEELVADLRKLTERLALPAPKPETWLEKLQRFRHGPRRYG